MVECIGGVLGGRAEDFIARRRRSTTIREKIGHATIFAGASAPVPLDLRFSDHGDNVLGARLSGASASLFFQSGLLPECVTWTEPAVGILDPAGAGTGLELELLACFSQST
jgi:hypothetical protein